MPWEGVTLSEQKQRFIEDFLLNYYSITELAQRFNISRKTAHKWINRYLEQGPAGLEERSRRKKSCPWQTDSAVVAEIVVLREKHPSWGPKKILDVMGRRARERSLPSIPTAARILYRAGLVKPRRRYRRAHPGCPQSKATEPNDIWPADYKGQFRLKNGKYCFPLTVSDLSSRFLLGVDADIVILQEVNNRLADALGEELIDVYPYQVLDPYNDVRGMGMISKLPLHLTGESLPLEWVGTPQILAVEWEGERVTLVNFHMWVVGLGPMKYIEINTRAREAHALYMIDFARIAAREGPVIVAGDANATPQSNTYRMLADWLQDSWTEAGYGLGHTFPESNVSGSTRLQLYGIPLPRWLFRIDYVFHSVELDAVEAFMAPFDGGSDHRALVVTFTMSE